MSTAALERGAPFVAPREMRANQGNPEITAHCPTCQERVVPLRSGLCGWCDTDLSADIPATNNHPERVETRSQPEPSLDLASPEPQPEPVITPETVDVARWRRGETVDWLRDNGPATQVEIAEHFGIAKGVLKYDIATLRAEGLIERTGVERSVPGRGGRPSPEFRAIEPGERDADHDLKPPPVPDGLLGASGDIVDRDGAGRTIAETIADRRDAGLTVDSTPFSDRPGATARTREIGEQVRRELEARYAAEDADLQELPTSQDGMTVHEQLVVRYLSALIGRVERAGMGGIQEPPDHVYARIERMLEITDGVR